MKVELNIFALNSEFSIENPGVLHSVKPDDEEGRDFDLLRMKKPLSRYGTALKTLRNRFLQHVSMILPRVKYPTKLMTFVSKK